MLKLALKNLFRRQERCRITVIGIAIGIAALIVLVGIGAGIKSAVVSSVMNGGDWRTIDVLPNVQGSRFFKLIAPGKGGRLDEDSLSEIRSLPEIKQVYPEYAVKNTVSVEGQFFGQILRTDSVVFAVNKDFIASELAPGSPWEDETNSEQEPIPFLLSSRLLDIYNFTIAQTNNFPLLREADFLGREVDINLGDSVLFPNAGGTKKNLRGRVVGFSPRVDLIGITVPLGRLEAFGPPESRTLHKIHALVRDEIPVVPTATKIESLGYTTDYPQKRLEGLEKKLSFILFGLSTISLTILVLVTLSVGNIFLAATRERRHEIGVFRALGAAKNRIIALFLIEAGLIGAAGGLLGIALGGGATLVINFFVGKSPWGQSEFFDQNLVLFGPRLLIASFLTAVFLSVLAAFFPARKAASLDPVQALKN